MGKKKGGGRDGVQASVPSSNPNRHHHCLQERSMGVLYEMLSSPTACAQIKVCVVCCVLCEL